MNLDVGCGNRPRGDVNCDLFVGYSPHVREGKERFIDPKIIPNFVKCTTNYLPFRKKTFSTTTAYAILEHEGVNFKLAFAELVRVTSSLVKILVPHRYNRFSTLHYKRPFHADRPFSVKSLDRWLQNQGFNASFEVTWKCFPHKVLCLVRLPCEIIVSIRVGEKYVHMERIGK